MVYQSIKILSIFDRILGQRAKLRKGGIQAIYKCPFCLHPKKKLEIAIGGDNFGSYHCWVCGISGKSFHTLLKKLKVSIDVHTEISQYTGTSYRYKNNDIHDNELSLPDEFISLIKADKTFECINALNYLESRNIIKKDIIRYNIGYCEHGDYKNRVIIPSYDKNGKLNFFCARAYNNHTNISYLLPPWDKNIVGFELLINWREPVTIVEGAFDAMAVVRNAVPLFGNTISEKLLLSIIENEVSGVNILLDNDAFSMAVEVYDILNRYNIKTKLIKLDEKDPSVLGFERVNEIINHADSTNYEDLIRMKISQ